MFVTRKALIASELREDEVTLDLLNFRIYSLIFAFIR